MTDTEHLLKKNYIKVLEVNLATDEFTALCLDKDERISGTTFTDWVRIFAEEGNIAKEMCDRYYNFFNINTLMKVNECEELNCSYLRLYANKWYDTNVTVFKSTKWTEDNPTVIVAVCRP